MGHERERKDAIDQLERALDADDPATKNYHVREALQKLVDVDESRTPRP